MLTNDLYGPKIETRRVHVPGTQTYVEIRSEFHADTAWFGYIIETGHVAFGHRGSWGRDNIREAMACFNDAVEYAATHHVGRDTSDPIWRPDSESNPDEESLSASFHIGTTGRILFIDDGPHTVCLTSHEVKRLVAFLADVALDCHNCLDPNNGVHAPDCPKYVEPIRCSICGGTVSPDSSYKSGYRHARPSLHGALVV